MADAPDPAESPEDSPCAVKRSGPKRGAFPTPQSEIDKAAPYLPGLPEEDGDPAESAERPADAEDESES